MDSSLGSMRSIAQWIADQFALGLSQAIESMVGEQAKVASKAEVTQTPSSAEAGLFWWEQTLTIHTQPAVFVGAPEKVWEEIGKRFLQAAGMQPESVAETRNSYQEILNQALAGLAHAIAEKTGEEVSTASGKETDGPAATNWLQIDVGLPGETLPPMVLGLSTGFLREVESLLLPKAEEEEQPSRDNEQRSARDAKMDLLLDVEMPISVSFGAARLNLKDVLKLNIGSIVELSRAVNEPVELIVNNCVVARGEVVVIEGNYGLRILQIVSRQERLRSVK